MERLGSFSRKARTDAAQQGVGRDETRPAAGAVGRDLQALPAHFLQGEGLHGAEFEAMIGV